MCLVRIRPYQLPTQSCQWDKPRVLRKLNKKYPSLSIELCSDRPRVGCANSWYLLFLQWQQSVIFCENVLFSLKYDHETSDTNALSITGETLWNQYIFAIGVSTKKYHFVKISLSRRVTVYPVIVVLEKVMKLHYSGHKLLVWNPKLCTTIVQKRPPKPDQNPIPVKVVLKKYLFILGHIRQ